MIICDPHYHILAKCKTCGATYWMDMIEHFKATGHENYDVTISKQAY